MEKDFYSDLFVIQTFIHDKSGIHNFKSKAQSKESLDYTICNQLRSFLRNMRTGDSIRFKCVPVEQEFPFF